MESGAGQGGSGSAHSETGRPELGCCSGLSAGLEVARKCLADASPVSLNCV